MRTTQPGVVLSVADLARQAAESLANEAEVAVGDVVVILFVRLQSGEYLQAATRQVSWDKWLITVVPGPKPMRVDEPV